MAETSCGNKPFCCCLEHDTWQTLYCSDKNNLIHIVRGKVKKSTVSFLRDKKLIMPRGQYLCQLCIKVATAKGLSATHTLSLSDQHAKKSRQSKPKNSIDILKIFTEFLEEYVDDKENDLEHYFSRILFLLASKLLKSRLTTDGNHLSKLYKDFTFLKDLHLKEFLMKRDILLISFLEEISGRDFNTIENSRQLFQVVNVIEQIFHLINFNWVLPHSFVTNMIQSCISGSKTVTAINGKLTTGGGYTTYLNWMKDNGNLPLICPAGDQVVYFDNIGRYINKNYRVSKEKIQPADIISTTIHIVLNNKCNDSLQEKENLKPINWHIKDKHKLQLKVNHDMHSWQSTT